MMYETSELFGKPIMLTDIMKQLEADYDIDFKKIHVNFSETEKEYVKGCKRIR